MGTDRARSRDAGRAASANLVADMLVCNHAIGRAGATPACGCGIRARLPVRRACRGRAAEQDDALAAGIGHPGLGPHPGALGAAELAHALDLGTVARLLAG